VGGRRPARLNASYMLLYSELTDFSIINFASHWQQAIGVSIVRGAASVVARAAPMGADAEEEEETAEAEASQEHSPDAR
jgi:hypothetical protein